MPEIWLNYGSTDVVLDIKAENLNLQINSVGKIMNDLSEKLDTLDTSIPTEFVLLNYTEAVKKIIIEIFSICERKSHPIPKILSDRKIMSKVKANLPEGSAILPFDVNELHNPNLIFVAEMEFDGLFGYETIATRLLRRFGREHMLSAYTKRRTNMPSPGQITDCMDEAKKFVDNFEIKGIEIVANSQGIMDFNIDHPANTTNLFETLGSETKIDKQKCLIISTGKDSSNQTLHTSLNSLWNCSNIIPNEGLPILLAECGFGLGSESFQQFVEERFTENLNDPEEYIDGMEQLLFLSELKNKFQIGIVSVLPELYIKKLGMVPLNSVKHALDYVLTNHGSRQKVSVVTDGARVLLR